MMAGFLQQLYLVVDLPDLMIALLLVPVTNSQIAFTNNSDLPRDL